LWATWKVSVLKLPHEPSFPRGAMIEKHLLAKVSLDSAVIRTRSPAQLMPVTEFTLASAGSGTPTNFTFSRASSWTLPLPSRVRTMSFFIASMRTAK
jgi:hypothetical protein